MTPSRPGAGSSGFRPRVSQPYGSGMRVTSCTIFFSESMSFPIQSDQLRALARKASMGAAAHFWCNAEASAVGG